MLKPDWKDSPEWAQWLAQDSNGKWFWYEREPLVHFQTWDADLKAESSRVAEAKSDLVPWRETLECRP